MSLSREVTSAAILTKLESSKLAALLGLDEGPVRLVLMVSPVHLVSPVRPTLPAQHSTQGEQGLEMILHSAELSDCCAGAGRGAADLNREPEIFRC